MSSTQVSPSTPALAPDHPARGCVGGSLSQQVTRTVRPLVEHEAEALPAGLELREQQKSTRTAAGRPNRQRPSHTEKTR